LAARCGKVSAEQDFGGKYFPGFGDLVVAKKADRHHKPARMPLDERAFTFLIASNHRPSTRRSNATATTTDYRQLTTDESQPVGNDNTVLFPMATSADFVVHL
jgi:hypothetical protein